MVCPGTHKVYSSAFTIATGQRKSAHTDHHSLWLNDPGKPGWLAHISA